MREKGREREKGLQAKIEQVWHVWLFFPFFPSSLLFFQFYPAGGKQLDPYIWQIREITKRSFWDWPSSAAAEQSEKEKHKADRQRKASSPPIMFFEISVWVADFPLRSAFCFILYLFLSFCLCCDCVSLSLSTCPADSLIFCFLFILMAVCPLHLSASISLGVFTCKESPAEQLYSNCFDETFSDEPFIDVDWRVNLIFATTAGESASLQVTSLTGVSLLQMQGKDILINVITVCCHVLQYVAFKNLPTVQWSPMISIHMQQISNGHLSLFATYLSLEVWLFTFLALTTTFTNCF